MTTLACLAVIEILLRLSGIAATGLGSPWFAGGSHPRFLFMENPESGYALRPGFEGLEVAATGEFRVPVRIGTDGLRSHPIAPEPGPRVLAIGDSMTFGEGVLENETWSAGLQGLGALVVNAGVPGYSSRQMLEQLRVELARRKPAAVLLMLSARWDFGRCSDPFVYREGYIVASSYADRLHLVGGNLYQEMFSQRWLARPSALAMGHSALFRLALPGLANLGAGDHRESRRHGRPPPDWRTYEPCLQALAAAQAESVAAGAWFRIALIDSPTEAFERDTRTLRRNLEEKGVAAIALDDWIPKDQRSSLRYPKDLHWNADGHQAVARALLSALPELFRVGAVGTVP